MSKCSSLHCADHLVRDLKSHGFKTDAELQLFWLVRNAPAVNISEFYFKKMKEEFPKMFDFLSKIENWRTCFLIEKKRRLYGIRASFSEVVFAHEFLYGRFELVTTFVKRIVLASATNMESMSKLALAYDLDITPSALKLFEERTNKLLRRGWSVQQTSSGDNNDEVAVVSLAQEKSCHSRGYIVNLSKKECDCKAWEQTEVPCEHSIAFMQYLNLSRANIFTSGKYGYLFGPLSSADSWRRTYQTPGIFTKIPSENDINSNGKLSLRMKTTSDGYRSRRIPSKGDSKPVRLKSKTTQPCFVCGKKIAPSTKHGPSACKKYAAKHPEFVENVVACRKEEISNYEKRLATGENQVFTFPLSSSASFMESPISSNGSTISECLLLSPEEEDIILKFDSENSNDSYIFWDCNSE